MCFMCFSKLAHHCVRQVIILIYFWLKCFGPAQGGHKICVGSGNDTGLSLPPSCVIRYPSARDRRVDMRLSQFF